MKKLLVGGCSLWFMTLALGEPAPALAQSIDYGSLQDLFGEPITVNATGTPQRASEVAANMTIITADEIRQSGSRNIPDILARVPGLDILQEAANSWDVGVRGYQQSYNPRLLVLIDGRQVFNDDYSRTNWDNLPVNIDDVRQIEVVKGPSSALFGSNATGGVVNIITYSPLYDKNNVASVSVGNQSLLTGDGTATIPLGSASALGVPDGQGGVKVSTGGLAMNEFDTARPSGELSKEVTRPSHRYVAQNSVYKVDSNFSFNTEANYTEKNSEESDFLFKLDPVKTTSYSAGGGFDWQTPYGLIKSTNYINHYNSDIAIYGDLMTSNSLIVSQLEDQFKLDPDNTFRAMLEYRHKDFASSNFPANYYEYPHLHENEFAAAGTWLWQINDKLSATNALRVDRNDMTMGGTILPNNPFTQAAFGQVYDTVTANSGLVYQATDLDSFRATYGRGVQNPSEIESGFNQDLYISPTINVDVVANPNLKPTVVNNYELGYDRKVNELFSTAKLSVYYQNNSNLIARSVLGSLGGNPSYGTINEEINVGDSRGWGGEMELKGSHPLGFRWDASYSYQTIRDAALVAQQLGYANSAPESHYRLQLGYTTGPWEFDTFGQYLTSTGILRTEVTGQQPVPVDTAGYASLSGRIGYRIDEHFTIAASATNINHDNLDASPYPAIEREAMLTLTGKF